MSEALFVQSQWIDGADNDEQSAAANRAIPRASSTGNGSRPEREPVKHQHHREKRLNMKPFKTFRSGFELTALQWA